MLLVTTRLIRKYTQAVATITAKIKRRQALSPGEAELRWVYNTLLEAFALHNRALQEFLFYDNVEVNPRAGREGAGDSACAADFVADGAAWIAKHNRQNRPYRGYYRRTNKEIAHLTFARSARSDSRRGWSVRYVKQTANALRHFKTKIPKELMSRKTRARWNALLRELP